MEKELEELEKLHENALDELAKVLAEEKAISDKYWKVRNDADLAKINASEIKKVLDDLRMTSFFRLCKKMHRAVNLFLKSK